MRKLKSLQLLLMSLTILIMMIVVSLEIYLWLSIRDEIITKETYRIFEEVNYQYVRQLDDRLQICKKIADSIKSNEKIKVLLNNVRNEKINFRTASSQITTEVMKQLNTVSVNLNVVKGVCVHTTQDKSITAYMQTGCKPLDIPDGWYKQPKVDYYDYYWISQPQDNLYMLTYIMEGTRIVALLEIEFIDTLLSEIVQNTSSGLNMTVKIMEGENVLYYQGEKETNDAISCSMLLNGGRWSIYSTLSDNYIDRETKRFIWYTFPIVLFALLLLLGVVLIFYRTVINPLKTITGGLQRVQSGCLDVRLPSATWREYEIVNENFNFMVVKLQELLDTIIKQNKKVRELEVLSLSAKFDPHFIYNTLDAIKWELELADRLEMSRLIVNFSTLLRYAVSIDDELPSIRRDFSFIERYIGIKQIQSPQSFEYRIELDDSIADYPIPRLLIQPLVENVIKYGFDGLEYTGMLLVSAVAAERGILITVSDNGQGLDKKQLDYYNWAFKRWEQGGESMVKNGGLGLYLVCGNVKTHYGSAYGLSLAPTPKGGLTVYVYIGCYPALDHFVSRE